MRRFLIALVCFINIVLSCRERVTEAPQTTTVKPGCREIEGVEIPAKDLTSIKPSIEINGSERTITCKAPPGNSNVDLYMEFDRYLNGKKEGTFTYPYNEYYEGFEGSLKATCDNEFGLYKLLEHDRQNIVRRETAPGNDIVFVLIRKVWCYGYSDIMPAIEPRSNVQKTYLGNCSLPTVMEPKLPPGYISTALSISEDKSTGHISTICDETRPSGYGRPELFTKIEHYLNGRLNHTEEINEGAGLLAMYMCTITNIKQDGYGFYNPLTGEVQLFTAFACAAPKLN